MGDAILSFLKTTGVAQLFSGSNWWQYVIMYVIVGVLFYLAVVKDFEPLLLLPIAFGMLLTNLPGANMMHLEFFFDPHYYQKFILETLNTDNLNILGEIIGQNGITSEMFPEIAESLTAEQLQLFVQQTGLNFGEYFNAEFHTTLSVIVKEVINEGGLLDILYLGVKLGIYPSLIFMGVGAMTDFSPLISNPKSLLMGAGAQLGVFAAFFFALFLGFTPMEAGAIGIIGGADGPTAILVTKPLAPQLLGAIAIAAYSYMALIPIIQPPFMRLLTTDAERKIHMENLRPVSQTEKIIFPVVVTALVTLIVPDAAPLIGFLMLGNFFNVSGVTDRLSKTAQNELCNIVTIFLGISVGATASAENFLKLQTIEIIILGLAAFCLSTVGGLLTGKLMCKLTKGKINPLIGSAGVSAVPMAARVSQDIGRQYDPSNFLLMHAMGPNVAGVIGSAVAAGVFLSFFK